MKKNKATNKALQPTTQPLRGFASAELCLLDMKASQKKGFKK